MEIISIILGSILGFFLFDLLNRIFNVYYFGFKGLSSTFLGCCAVGIGIVMILGYFAKWIVLICAVIWLLRKLFGKKSSSNDGSNNTSTNVNQDSATSSTRHVSTANTNRTTHGPNKRTGTPRASVQNKR
jgi:uncharacterized BrkB/YihY/UPF0761 family membrane protein